MSDLAQKALVFMAETEQVIDSLNAELSRLREQNAALLLALKAAKYVLEGGYVGLKRRHIADAEALAIVRPAIAAAERKTP